MVVGGRGGGDGIRGNGIGDGGGSDGVTPRYSGTFKFILIVLFHIILVLVIEGSSHEKP